MIVRLDDSSKLIVQRCSGSGMMMLAVRLPLLVHQQHNVLVLVVHAHLLSVVVVWQCFHEQIVPTYLIIVLIIAI